jgi:nitrogen regulatory protein P-II 1
MKRVEAYIQPFMLTRVLHELRQAHVHGLTVSDVRGFGREKDESYPHHASDYAVDFTPKVKLELLCHDDEVEALLSVLQRGAHTGRRGDGKILVSPIERLMSIRTEEEGDAAI